MPDTAKKPDRSSFPEYDWSEARRTLIFYFSRRGMMNSEDLAHETLTRLLNWLHRENHVIQGEAGFMKTAYGFARNVLLEKFREQSHLTEELSEDIPAAVDRVRGLDTQEAIAYLHELLQQLPERDRQLIVDAEKKSQPDIAEEMGVPLSTLRVWLHRAREKLRALEMSSQASSGWE
jgi:RNA polymerase sigma factor (sigma-70 family)